MSQRTKRWMVSISDPLADKTGGQVSCRDSRHRGCVHSSVIKVSGPRYLCKLQIGIAAFSLSLLPLSLSSALPLVDANNCQQTIRYASCRTHTQSYRRHLPSIPFTFLRSTASSATWRSRLHVSDSRRFLSESCRLLETTNGAGNKNFFFQIYICTVSW